MKMRLLRAVILGILLYVLTWVDIFSLMFISQLAGQHAFQTLIHLVILPVWTLICGYFYFRKRKGSISEGFWFGVIILLVNAVLDFSITIPVFILPTGAGFFEFYNTWSIWIGFAEVLIFTALSGMVFGKK